MGIASLVLTSLLLGGTTDEEPAELVGRLGSPRFSEREAAAGALRRLGPSALPSLREASGGRDLEIKARASVLIDEIEAVALLSPTMVRLDFQDRPLGEVIEEFGHRGIVWLTPDLSFMSPNAIGPTPWPDRRVTIEAAEPLPFWSAFDRLCQAGGLHRLRFDAHKGFDDSINRMILARGTATPPKADTGPFRVELLRVCREREINLAPDQGEDGHNSPFPNENGSNFFAEILLSSEPRLRMIGTPSLENVKVIDLQGKSIRREPTEEEREAERQMFLANPQIDPKIHPELRFGSGYSSSSTVHLLRIPLDESTPPGGRIATLKGLVAVAVMARRPGPLVLPLGDSNGKTIAGDGVRLTIHEAEVKPSQWDADIDLTLENERNAGTTIAIRGPGIEPVEISRPSDYLPYQIEFTDAKGQPLDWNYTQTPDNGNQGRMKIQVRPRVQFQRLDLNEVKIRIHAIATSAAEVPFSFADVPMP